MTARTIITPDEQGRSLFASDLLPDDDVTTTGGTSFVFGHGFDLHDVEVYLALGGGIARIERAPSKPELPDNPGWYQDRLGGIWDVSQGRWRAVDVEAHSGFFAAEDVVAFSPFVRLLPVPQVAGQVIDRLRELVWSDSKSTAAEDFAQVASEFGVEL